MSILIYGLTDEHGQIRYVGQTIRPEAWFLQHAKIDYPFVVMGMAHLGWAATDFLASILERKWIAFFGLENLHNRNEGGRFFRTRSPYKLIPLPVRLSMAQDQWLQGQADKEGHGSKAHILRMLVQQAMKNPVSGLEACKPLENWRWVR